MSLFQSLLSAGGFDAGYLAILARGTALGYTLPSAAQQVKQNAYVLALKAAGIWTLLDVLYVFATDGNSDFATLNWKAPTLFQCSKVNSPTFTTNQGFNGNGSTSYLNTGWNPSANGSNYTQNIASAFHAILDNAASLRSFGARNLATTQQLLFTTTPPTLQYVVNQTADENYASATIDGFWHQRRTTVNNYALFKNGVSVDTGVVASTPRPAFNVYICANNTNNVADSFGQCKIGVWGAGASLNGLELANYNAWNTYFTSL